MTEISIHYHNGVQYNDLTPYAKAFKVEDHGLTRVGTAVVELLAKRSDLSAFLASPYQFIRIRMKPADTWQNIFFGYIDNPHEKALVGTATEVSRVLLECFSFEQRLATDYVTRDYYKSQSALLPLNDPALCWTYRKVIEHMLENPDSTRDGSGLSGINFDVVAATDANGIDHAIDKSCNWSRQTIFEAIREIGEHIGYDGYYYMASESATPEIRLYPFDKATAGYLNAPFIKEPEVDWGSLNDIANVIFVWGGIDAGIPSDGDRWTEYGYSKYNPTIWEAYVSNGNAVITDVDNTVLSETNRFNTKCIKTTVTGSTSREVSTILKIFNTEWQKIDAQNRCSVLNYAVKDFGCPESSNRFIRTYLKDNTDKEIFADWTAFAYENNEDYVTLQLNTELHPVVAGSERQPKGLWIDPTYGTPFNWSNIVKAEIRLRFPLGETLPTGSWGTYIDGLQFVGGYNIEPFHDYSPTPAKDQTSINQYGVHPLHYQDNQILSFEQAQAEAQRLLANLAYPNPTTTLTKIADGSAYRPSMVVNCNTVDQRITKMIYDWNAAQKDVHITYTLVGKTKPLPPIWTEQNELRFLIK